MTIRLAVTCNGPGEFAGWVRPLAHAFARLAPQVELHCFFVPDDYATGREAEVAPELVPGLHVHPPGEYLKFAIGGRTELHDFAGVLYLGGDVLHAVRIHTRVGGAFFAYRYAPKHIAKRVRHAFALDEKNARQMAKTIAADKISVVGNLAVDGAKAQASGEFGAAAAVIKGGIMFMPGSRRHEIRHLFPFFATAAMRLQQRLPDAKIFFGISPFTQLGEIDAAIQAAPDPHLYSRSGKLITLDGAPHLQIEGAVHPFPIVRDALQSAIHSRVVATIPGTKSIELTSLGVPHIVCTPFNIPERAVINGPLTYLDRLPFLGRPLKRAAVMAFANRFRYYAQTNIDVNFELVPELQGTLTPGQVAEKLATLSDDTAWQETVGPQCIEVYAAHAGASERLVHAVLRECTGT